MDLKSFVSETLVSIAEGVALARRQGVVQAERPLVWRASESLADCAMTEVRFDIALTVSEEADLSGSRKAGFNIRLVEASLGRETASRKRDEAVSRVAFAIPLRLPAEAGPAPMGRPAPCALEQSRTGGGASCGEATLVSAETG